MRDSAGRGSDPDAPGPGGRDETSEDSLDASPHSAALPESVRCPHCGGEETEQFSSFGSALSVSQYYCRGCRTVFESFKWRRHEGS